MSATYIFAAYVALSRCRNLESLQLLDFKPAVIKAHPAAREFYRNIRTAGSSDPPSPSRSRGDVSSLDQYRHTAAVPTGSTNTINSSNSDFHRPSSQHLPLASTSNPSGIPSGPPPATFSGHPDEDDYPEEECFEEMDMEAEEALFEMEREHERMPTQNEYASRGGTSNAASFTNGGDLHKSSTSSTSSSSLLSPPTAPAPASPSMRASSRSSSKLKLAPGANASYSETSNQAQNTVSEISNYRQSIETHRFSSQKHANLTERAGPPSSSTRNQVLDLTLSPEKPSNKPRANGLHPAKQTSSSATNGNLPTSEDAGVVDASLLCLHHLLPCHHTSGTYHAL